MRHGEERHLIRPDGVYYTGVLSAIPGYHPVTNAQEVAARFTAICQPRVQDALQGAFAERRPGLLERLRLALYRARFERALRRMGLRGPDDMRFATHSALTSSSAVGGAPPFNRQADAALALTMMAVAQGSSSFPPVMNPAPSAAAAISPIATEPIALSAQLVRDRMGGMVGQQADAADLWPFLALRAPSWGWWREY